MPIFTMFSDKKHQPETTYLYLQSEREQWSNLGIPDVHGTLIEENGEWILVEVMINPTDQMSYFRHDGYENATRLPTDR
jgi:hypothetical protein